MGVQANGYSQPKPKAKPRVERNRVLVTGGAGFVGSHLCAFLVGRGDHVRRRPARSPHPRRQGGVAPPRALLS